MPAVPMLNTSHQRCTRQGEFMGYLLPFAAVFPSIIGWVGFPGAPLLAMATSVLFESLRCSKPPPSEQTDSFSSGRPSRPAFFLPLFVAVQTRGSDRSAQKFVDSPTILLGRTGAFLGVWSVPPGFHPNTAWSSGRKGPVRNSSSKWDQRHRGSLLLRGKRTTFPEIRGRLYLEPLNNSNP